MVMLLYDEIRQIHVVMSMKNSSACWDDFLALVAKQSIDSYIEPLTCLINISFKDVIFPSELKLARVFLVWLLAITNEYPF